MTRGEGVMFLEGDRFAYRSTSSGHVVTWTRNAGGVWTADDGRDMPATDADVLHNYDPSETTLTDANGDPASDRLGAEDTKC